MEHEALVQQSRDDGVHDQRIRRPGRGRRHRVLSRGAVDAARLAPTDAVAWGYLPLICQRITRFCESYATELKADSIVAMVKAHFVAETGDVGVWAIMDGRDLVGHTLVLMERREGLGKVAFVLQIESDVQLPSGLGRRISDDMALWAHQHEAVCLEAVTWLPARVYEPLGFSFHRTVIRRAV